LTEVRRATTLFIPLPAGNLLLKLQSQDEDGKFQNIASVHPDDAAGS